MGEGQPPALPGNWNLFLVATYKTKKNLREIWGWGGRARWPRVSLILRLLLAAGKRHSCPLETCVETCVFFLRVSVCGSPEPVIQILLAGSFLSGEEQVMAYL